MTLADEGISGTQAAKRPQFLRMIRQCRQKKIDLVLVKSISRFARNTVDCLNYVRALRELSIAILFEEQNINTLETDGELLLTLLGAVVQGESGSISENVKWGKRQALREGKAAIQYKRLYAFEKGEDGKPRIIPEQAEVVRQIYNRFLGGHSLRMIKDALQNTVDFVSFIHVGVDTVEMGGDGFRANVKEGQIIKKGGLLLTMDVEKIKAAGHPAVVIMTVTNSDDVGTVEAMCAGAVEPGNDVLKVSK